MGFNYLPPALLKGRDDTVILCDATAVARACVRACVCERERARKTEQECGSVCKTCGCVKGGNGGVSVCVCVCVCVCLSVCV